MLPMLPRNFPKGLVVIIIFLILAFIGSTLFSKQFFKKQSSSFEPQRVFPNEVVSQVNTYSFKIIYQDPSDKIGRTILYESGNKNLYNGIGKSTFNTGQVYYTGKVSNWTSDNSSRKNTLGLTNPINGTSIQTFDILYTPDSTYPTMKKGTLLSLENLTKSMNPYSLGHDEGVEDYKSFIIPLREASPQNLQEWIKDGDAVVVFPVMEKSGNKSLNEIIGSNGNPIAEVILIRRTNGSKDIKK